MQRPLLFFAALLLLVPGPSPTALAGEGKDVDAAVARLLVAAPGAPEQAAAKALLALDADPLAVAKRIAAGHGYGPPPFTGWRVEKWHYADGKDRSYHVYIPKKYDPKVPAPVLIHLHGGVSRPEPLSVKQMKEYRDWWKPEADEHGFITIFPLGERSAMWWTKLQADAIEGMVRSLSRTVNVDRNRVFVTGFSDGGSGCYYLAMTHPTMFAGFAPLNGHPAVASEASGRQLYPVNFAMRPVFAVNTQADPLYPAVTVLPFISTMMKVGCQVRFTTYPGIGHTPAYRSEQDPLVADWMVAHPRDPLPDQVTWETADLDTGRASWVKILALGKTPGAPKLPDVNVMSTPGRVKVGIYPDPKFEGKGVLIDKVVPESVAVGLGLTKGDVITAIDGKAVSSLRALRSILGKKHPGDSIRVTWTRGKDVKSGTGKFKPFVAEPVFSRGKPSGRIEVTKGENRVDVKLRGVTRYVLSLSPSKFDFGKVITVVTNGKVSFWGRVKPSLETLLTAWRRDRDPAMLFAARLTIDVK